jgi:hypothetical protein
MCHLVARLILSTYVPSWSKAKSQNQTGCDVKRILQLGFMVPVLEHKEESYG